MVADSVWWRAGPWRRWCRCRRSRRSSRRRCSVPRLTTPTRLAASSMASGSPSSVRTSRVTAAAVASSTTRSGEAARARSRKRATEGTARSTPSAAGSSSGDSQKTCSAGRPSLSRLVASTRRPVPCSDISLTRSETAPTTCSQLSSTRVPSAVESRPRSAASGVPPGKTSTPSADAVTDRTPASVLTLARSTHHREGSWDVARLASAVLPTPPGPTRVTKRWSPSSVPRSARSTSRPCSAATGGAEAGALACSARTGPPDRGGSAPATGGCCVRSRLSTRRCISSSSGAGSRPSFLGQGPAMGRERRQRLRGGAAAVQGVHEHRDRPVPQGVLGHQEAEVSDRLGDQPVVQQQRARSSRARGEPPPGAPPHPVRGRRPRQPTPTPATAPARRRTRRARGGRGPRRATRRRRRHRPWRRSCRRGSRCPVVVAAPPPPRAPGGCGPRWCAAHPVRPRAAARPTRRRRAGPR